MYTFNHTALNARSAPQHAYVTGPLAKGTTGSVTSVTCSALPTIRDIVQVWDGNILIAQVPFTSGDSPKLNVAQTISKAYSDTKGLLLKIVSDGGLTGTYALAYS